MKFTVVAALMGAAVVSATGTESSLPELFARIPTCADKCVADAMPGLCPSVESYWCRCHSSVKGRLMSKTFDCAIEACGGIDEAMKYQEATNSVCEDIKEVTLRGQKHVELRQVGSASVTKSVTRSVSVSASATGSQGSGRATTNTRSVVSTGTLSPATGAASALTVGSSSSGMLLVGSVAGLAIASLFGLLA